MINIIVISCCFSEFLVMKVIPNNFQCYCLQIIHAVSYHINNVYDTELLFNLTNASILVVTISSAKGTVSQITKNQPHN